MGIIGIVVLTVILEIMLYLYLKRSNEKLDVEYNKSLHSIIKNRIINYTEEKMILERKLFLLKHKDYRTAIFKKRREDKIKKFNNRIID